MLITFSFAKVIGIAATLGLLFVSSPSHAKKACFGKGEKLEIVASTGLKAIDGEPLVLAHKTTTHCFLVPYWLTDDGFVLGVKGNDKAYYPLPEPERLKALQAAGLVPSPFPKWERSWDDWIGGYFFWWFTLGLIIFIGLKLRGQKNARQK
jgi:hypothetical protein